MWLEIDSGLQANDSKWLNSSCDFNLTRLDQVMTLTLTRKNFRWLEGLVTLTRQKWLGHITELTMRKCSNLKLSECFYQWCVRVIFVESQSSQSHLKFFRVRVMTWSSRVTRTVESLRVIGLPARVNVESHEILRFFCNIFLLWNDAQ